MKLLTLMSNFSKDLSAILTAYENGIENLFPTLEAIYNLKCRYFKKIDRLCIENNNPVKNFIYAVTEEAVETICLLYKEWFNMVYVSQFLALIDEIKMDKKITVFNVTTDELKDMTVREAIINYPYYYVSHYSIQTNTLVIF